MKKGKHQNITNGAIHRIELCFSRTLMRIIGERQQRIGVCYNNCISRFYSFSVHIQKAYVRRNVFFSHDIGIDVRRHCQVP